MNSILCIEILLPTLQMSLPRYCLATLPPTFFLLAVSTPTRDPENLSQPLYSVFCVGCVCVRKGAFLDKFSALMTEMP